MPDYKIGPIIHDDPRRLEKIKLKISAEAKSKGKAHLKDPVTGFEISDEQFLLSDIISVGEFPSSKIIATPAPRSQGSEGSCVSWAIGYVARSVEQYYATGASSYADAINTFSPEYLFNQVKATICTGGSTLMANLDLMKNKGICLWSTLPYTSGTCDIETATAHDAEAANYKISDYFIVSTIDKIAVKTALINNKTLYFACSVDSAFYNAGSNFIWNSSTATSTILGQHALIIIGYDDSKNAYKVQNSWGTGWGDSGFTWIDYDYMSIVSSIVVGINAITGPVGEPSTLPTANAGFDQNVPTTAIVILDGTKSSDVAEGYISSYSWEQLSGPNTATLTNTTSPVASATGLVAGTYVFELTVTDNEDNSATDTVTIVATSTDKVLTTVTKTTLKGKVTDKVSWEISLSVPIQYAELQVSITGSTWNFLYSINPYRNIGTESFIPVNQKVTRYYRLKVVQSDGVIKYSPSVHIK